MSSNPLVLLGELKEESKRLHTELQEVIDRNGGNDDFNNWPPGQVVRAENLMRAIDRVDDGVLKIEAGRAADLEDVRRAAALPGGLEPVSPEDPPTLRRSTGDGQRDRAARILDDAHRAGTLPDAGAEGVQRLLDEGPAGERSVAADWDGAAGSPAYLTAFTKMLGDPTRGHMLWTPQEQAAYAEVQVVRTALSTGTGHGAEMLPLVLDPAIIITNAGSTSSVRQVARTVQTISNAWHGVSSAGATAEWKAEGTEAADGTPNLADIEVPVFLGDVFAAASFEVWMDGVNIALEIQRTLADAAMLLQATAFTVGNGTTAPQGFVTGLAGGASEVAPKTGETFADADVYNLIEQLPARFRPNAKWMANLSVLNLIDQFETTNGAKMFPGVGADPSVLLRRGVVENSDMDGSWNTSATANNYILAVGDWSQYVIADRVGSTVELVPNLFGGDGRPTGQRGMLLYFRTGGKVDTINAFRLLNLATAA